MDLRQEIEKHKALEKDLTAVAQTLKGGAKSGLLTKAMKMVMSGKFDLEALGLPADVVETLEAYQKCSNNLRAICVKVADSMEAQKDA